MKKIIYSITGFSFSLAAALGILVSLLGIFFVWRMAPAVTERLVASATFAQKALDTTETLLDVVDTSLEKVEESVALVAESTEQVAETLNNTSAITSSVADTLGDEFTGMVEKTQTALTALETSAKLVDDTLSFISSIPFIGTSYSKKAPLQSSVVEINESMSELPQTLQEMEEKLSSTAQAFTSLNDSVNDLAENVGEIEASIQEAGVVVKEYQVLLDEAQRSTANIIEKLPRWVRWAAVGLTLLFVWLIVIQAGLLMFGMEMAGWRKEAPLEQPAEDVSPSASEPVEVAPAEDKEAQQEEPAKDKKKKKKAK